MSEIVIFGAGKIAEVAYGYFAKAARYRVVAFVCDRGYCGAGEFLGKPCVPFDDAPRRFPPERYGLFVAIGYHALNALRAERYARAKQIGYHLVNCIDPGAWLPENAEIGDNCMVLDGATVQPGARIGNNVALWSGAMVGHHSRVNDHCWLAAGATLGGNCEVGEATFVGLNATLGHGVQVGRRCLIGARALLTKALADERVVADRDSETLRIDSPHFLKISKLT